VADERDDAIEPFGALFGVDDSTEDEGEKERRERDRRRNDAAERAFDEERDRRTDYLHMDQRIRNIVSVEINKLLLKGMVIVGAYSLGREYGWPAGLALLIAAGALYWSDNRKAQKLPRFKIEEVDQLAEDSVTHELIVAYEGDGKPWLWTKGQYLHWEGLFDHPYWETVNLRVRSYVRMSHQQRIADNKAARVASLPFRKAMIARLREQDAEWELPGWARLNSEERS